jgi:hypothetical protein
MCSTWFRADVSWLRFLPARRLYFKIGQVQRSRSSEFYEIKTSFITPSLHGILKRNNMPFHSFQLSPSGIALFFDGFGSISCHFILVFIQQFFRIFTLFSRISNFIDLSITGKTWVVEMRIWCIEIGNVLVLHVNP